MPDEFSLPWNFEAFRRFVVYERLQQAASVLQTYEGEEIRKSNPRIDEIHEDFQKRTGEEWIPDREVSEDVRFNVEGNFYRNKGRLLTSLLIMRPKQLQDGTPRIELTDFGHALARGEVSRDEFYEEIIKRYQFPHPAYDQNWEEWRSADRSLKPLVFILQIFVELFERGNDPALLNSPELATFAYPESDHGAVEGVVDDIEEYRESGGETREYSDKVNRKINDMMGFLCISGFTYYDGLDVGLNLMGVHPDERTHYWKKRSTRQYEEANKLENIKDIITDSLTQQ